ncbi:MAG: AAA family ATPase [bacterium]
MNYNSKNTIIIDFFGLPGSGKTTIAHMLAKKLDNSGYDVQENIYIINNLFSSRKRMVLKFLCMIKYSIKNLFFLYEIFSIIGNDTFKNYREALKQWINICFILTNINKKNNSNFIIADQGIVQAAISLTVNTDKNKLRKIISKLCERIVIPITFVYIDIDIETDLQRLEGRINGKSRVEMYNKAENREKELQNILLRCEEILGLLDCIVIENNVSTKNNQDVLNNIVEKLLCSLKLNDYNSIIK